MVSTHGVHQSKGLEATLKAFLRVIEDLKTMEVDIEKLTKPNTPIPDRVNCYAELAEIVERLPREFAGIGTKKFVSDCMSAVDKYLKNFKMELPDPGSGPAMIPVQINGHDATLYDFIQAHINNQTNATISVHVHFNECRSSVNQVSWLDFKQVGDTVQSGMDRSNDDKSHPGVSWNTYGFSSCNNDSDLSAHMSEATCEKYATAVGDATGTDYQDLTKIITDNIPK